MQNVVPTKLDGKLVFLVNTASFNVFMIGASLVASHLEVVFYYSMFHSARALPYSKGFREKIHRAILAAPRELLRNKIDLSLLDIFSDL